MTATYSIEVADTGSLLLSKRLPGGVHADTITVPASRARAIYFDFIRALQAAAKFKRDIYFKIDGSGDRAWTFEGTVRQADEFAAMWKRKMDLMKGKWKA